MSSNTPKPSTLNRPIDEDTLVNAIHHRSFPLAKIRCTAPTQGRWCMQTTRSALSIYYMNQIRNTDVQVRRPDCRHKQPRSESAQVRTYPHPQASLTPVV